ncbi:MAG: DUF29 domain-containing protein [Gemmatimonadaceae bacterium]|nr:DUF29 domain-containing protein [Acetobacteraceae bacterium]
MTSSLYDTDILTWSEVQAALLRRLAAGERLNDAIDWPNVIEELESLGRSDLKSCTSLLRQALIHLLKIHAEPGSSAVRHWRGETAGFLIEVRDAYTPSMRQHIDLDALYSSAIYRFRAGAPAKAREAPVSPTCPHTLDDLLAHEPDIDALAARLTPCPTPTTPTS